MNLASSSRFRCDSVSQAELGCWLVLASISADAKLVCLQLVDRRVVRVQPQL